MTHLRIACRLWTWAVALRLLKHVVPLDRLVRLAHPVIRHTSSRERGFERVLEQYMASRRRFPARAPANCLERSLGAYRLLCTAGAEPILVVGLKRLPEALLGHVWVVVDGRALAERPEDLSTYTPVVTFDSRARQHPAGGGGLTAGMKFA